MFHQNPIKARDRCRLIRVSVWETHLRELSNCVSRGMTYDQHLEMMDWELYRVLLWYGDK